MKTLVPFLAILACLNSGCRKDADLKDLAPASQSVPGGEKAKMAGLPSPALFNGFEVNGAGYNAVFMGKTHATHEQYWFLSYDDGGATFTFSMKDPLPPTDGIYAYRLDNDLTNSGNMQIGCHLNSLNSDFELHSPSGQIALVKIAAGTVSVGIPDITLETLDGPVTSISINANLSFTQPRPLVRTTKPNIFTF